LSSASFTQHPDEPVGAEGEHAGLLVTGRDEHLLEADH
jgi:hypothetical protein